NAQGSATPSVVPVRSTPSDPPTPAPRAAVPPERTAPTTKMPAAPGATTKLPAADMPGDTPTGVPARGGAPATGPTVVGPVAPATPPPADGVWIQPAEGPPVWHGTGPAPPYVSESAPTVIGPAGTTRLPTVQMPGETPTSGAASPGEPIVAPPRSPA